MPYFPETTVRLIRENFTAMVEPAFERAYSDPETIKFFSDLFSEDEATRKITEARITGMWQSNAHQNPIP